MSRHRSLAVRVGAAAGATAVLVALVGCTTDSPVDPTTSATTASNSSTTGSASGSTSPSATGSSTGSAQPSPTDTTPIVNLILGIELQRPPVWGVEKAEGWTAVVIDAQGMNKFDNANGCTLTTVQTAGTIPPIDVGNGFTEPATDATGTKAFLEQATKQSRQSFADFATEGGITSFPIPFGVPSSQRFEFAHLEYTYTQGTPAVRWRAAVLARVMPKSGSRMVATLSCPESQLEAARGFLGGLKVLPG